MYGISVDLSPLLDIPFEINSKMEEAMDLLSYEFEQELMDNAKKILDTGRDEYIDAVYRDYDGEGTWSVGIKGSWLAASLEDGSESFDMKQSFSKNAKQSKNGGWYKDIPFKHKTSRASDEMRGYASKMPSSVYKAALGAAKSGQRLSTSGIQPSTITPYKSSYNTNKIYSSMFRTKMSGRTSWMTIRRISSNSPSGSWIHPGFTAKNIIPMTIQSFDIESKFKDLMQP